MLAMFSFYSGRGGNIFLLTCSLAVALAAAEIVLRLASVGYGAVPMDGHPVLHHTQPSSYEFTVYDVNDEFGGHIVTYDEDGFRVPYNGYDYVDSLRDVVFLGDSFVEASEVPYEKSFVGLFDKEFEKYNVRNFGVSSYSPLISYLQVKYYSKTIKPTMIVHLIFENDLADDSKYYDLSQKKDGIITAVPGKPITALHRFLRRFYVARLIKRAQITIQEMANNKLHNNEKKKSIYLEDPVIGEITRHFINKISQFVNDNDIQYLLMCVPSKLKFNQMREHKDICEKIKLLSSELEIEYVDLDDFFSRHISDRKPFFEIDTHFNELGHRLTYLALIDYLRSPDTYSSNQTSGK